MVTHSIFAERSVSVSALAKDPLAVVAKGEGFAVTVFCDAVFNQNQPAFYCVPAKA